MSITQEEVERISKKLAKLNPKDIKKLVKDSNSILEYVNLLNEIDTTWITPTVSVISKPNNSLKKDEITQTISPEKLLKCSSLPKIANQIAIKEIF